MFSKEIMSGEITSRKAKLVLYPILVIYILNFVSLAVCWQITGYSGFTAGTADGTGYSVVEHGRTMHVTTAQYRLGRIQVVTLFLGVAIWFIARAYFFRTGDLRREKRAA
jgi:hypothetical protein